MISATMVVESTALYLFLSVPVSIFLLGVSVDEARTAAADPASVADWFLWSSVYAYLHSWSASSSAWWSYWSNGASHPFASASRPYPRPGSGLQLHRPVQFDLHLLGQQARHAVHAPT